MGAGRAKYKKQNAQKAREALNNRTNGAKILHILEASGEFKALFEIATASNLFPQISLVPRPDKPSSVSSNSSVPAGRGSSSSIPSSSVEPSGYQSSAPELENVEKDKPEEEKGILNCTKILQLLEASGKFKSIFDKATAENLLPQISLVPGPEKNILSSSSAPAAASAPSSFPKPEIAKKSAEGKSNYEQFEEEISANSNATIITTSCFVCHSDLLHQYRRGRATPEDCEVIFEDFLEIPEDLIKQYKSQFGPLQQWILFCKPCHSVMREGRQLKQQINELQTQLMDCKYKMVTAIKSNSLLRRRDQESSTPQSPKGAAIRTIQNFVTSRSYKGLEEKIQNALEKTEKINRLKRKTVMLKKQSKHKKMDAIIRRLAPPSSSKAAASGSTPTLLHTSLGKLTSDRNFMDDDDYATGSDDDGGINYSEYVLEKEEDESEEDEDEDESMIDIDDLNNYSSNNSNNAPHITVSSIGDGGQNKSELFHCGLCLDFEAFGSESMLAEHQNTIHFNQQNLKVDLDSESDSDSMQIDRRSHSTNKYVITAESTGSTSRKRKAGLHLHHHQSTNITEMASSEAPIKGEDEDEILEKPSTDDTTVSCSKTLKIKLVPLPQKPGKAPAAPTPTASQLYFAERKKKKMEEVGMTEAGAEESVKDLMQTPTPPSLETQSDSDSSTSRLNKADDFGILSKTLDSEIVIVKGTESEAKEVKANPAKPSYLSYRYSCPNCTQVKKYGLNRYAQHLAIHQRRPYRCSECFEFLPDNPTTHELHWKDKHRDKEPCPGAAKFVKIKFDAGEIWKCQGQDCSDGFFTEEERNSHETSCEMVSKSKTDTASAKTCVTCNKEFRDLADWRFHRLLSHPEVDSISCLYCDETFAEKLIPVDGDDEANYRVTRNEKRMFCHLRTEHIEDRMNATIKQAIYSECEMCGIVFVMASAYIAHTVKRHGFLENSVYPCNFCEGRYPNVDSLRRHLAGLHFLNQNEIICDLCGQKFKKRKSFINHNYQVHGIVEEGAEVINCFHPGCSYKSVVKTIVTQHFMFMKQR